VQLRPFTHGLRSTLRFEAGAVSPVPRLRWPGKLALLCWHQLRWPCVDPLVPDADVLFSPNYLVLPTRLPLLVTVHDLFFLDGPGRDWWSGGFLSKHLSRHLERRAAHVLTDSKAVLQRLLDRFPALEGRASVLYPGLRKRFRRRADAEAIHAVRQRLALPGQFLLCAGDLSPRKNQLVLLDALKTRQPGKLPPLVLCGLSAESQRHVLSHAARLGLAPGAVLTLPYLDEPTLHAVVSASLGVVTPSLDEGFGLPVAEALSLGVPVACSSAGSLREASGGLALYFDAMDPEAIAQALETLASDEEARGMQIAGGPIWTLRFDDDAAAAALYGVAREVIGARRA
jgi:glycosyltransferase involved in cell wall biosynthesis